MVLLCFIVLVVAKETLCSYDSRKQKKTVIFRVRFMYSALFKELILGCSIHDRISYKTSTEILQFGIQNFSFKRQL